MPPHQGGPPLSKVVVITATDDEAVRTRAFELGASSFLLKQCIAEELEPIIQQAFRGDRGIRATDS